MVKNPPANAGDSGLIPELGTPLGAGNGNSRQYSCLENPMDGRAWRGAVHGIEKLDMTEHSTHSRKAAKVLSWCTPEIYGYFISKKQNLTKSQSFLPPTNSTLVVFPASCPQKPCGLRCAAAEQLMALLVSEAMRDASFPI